MNKLLSFLNIILCVTFIIGITILLISRFCFENQNDVLMNVVNVYCPLTLLISMIPTELLVVAICISQSIKNKRKLISVFLQFTFITVIWIVYIISFVACTGGI